MANPREVAQCHKSKVERINAAGAENSEFTERRRNQSRIHALHSELLLGRQELLLNGRNHYVVRIDHLREMDFPNLGKELVSIEFRKAIVGVNPGHQLGESNPHGVVYGAIEARRHYFLFVPETAAIPVFPPSRDRTATLPSWALR